MSNIYPPKAQFLLGQSNFHMGNVIAHLPPNMCECVCVHCVGCKNHVGWWNSMPIPIATSTKTETIKMKEKRNSLINNDGMRDSTNFKFKHNSINSKQARHKEEDGEEEEEEKWTTNTCTHTDTHIKSIKATAHGCVDECARLLSSTSH